MSKTEIIVEFYLKQKGVEISVGEWIEVDQSRINAFAEATGDMQWIHIDPERAKIDSPYKSTVAHGFLTLSMLPLLTQSNAPGQFEKNYPGMRLRVNYGLNKVRFPSPVKPGDRIRARTKVLDASLAGNGAEIIYLLTIDIDGSAKPACIAEQVVRVYP